MNKKKFIIGILTLSLTGLLVLAFYIHSISQFVQIPVNFAPCNTPLVRVKIEEQNYDLRLDLGSKFQLTLSKSVLDTLQKKPSQKVSWRDVKGKFYESQSYHIRNIDVENLTLKDVSVIQENDDFVTNTTLWNDNPGSGEFGMLGRPILEKTNLLLDCSRSKIIATNNKRMLKKSGYDLDQMVKIPIIIDKKGMIVSVETDVGTLRCVLDTGSTLTLVRASSFQDRKINQDNRGFSVFQSSKFVMEKKDFGEKKLYLYELAPDVKEVDGLLGMDFFKNHVIYFDYVHKCIYIGS